MREVEQQEFLQDVLIEVNRAEKNYPYPNQNLAKLTEEAGEVARAFVRKENYGRVYAECVQVAAMAMRCALEGDPQFHA